MSEEKKYRRSLSQLKDYTKCQEMFRLKRLHRLPKPERPAPWTFFGNAFHSTFESWEREHRVYNPVEMFEANYDNAVRDAQERVPEEQVWQKPPHMTFKGAINHYRKRGIEKDVPQFRDRCIDATKENLWKLGEDGSGSPLVEVPFEIAVEDEQSGHTVEVRGEIDRVLYWPSLDVHTVEDIKTGKPDDDNDLRQLLVYSYALGNDGWDIDAGRYWYSKNNQPGQWHMLSGTERAVQQYIKLDRQVQASVEHDSWLPNPGAQCTMCDVKPWCSLMGWLQEDEPLTPERVEG